MENEPRHKVRDHKPQLGQRDFSIPEPDDHDRHVRLILGASRVGFPAFAFPAFTYRSRK